MAIDPTNYKNKIDQTIDNYGQSVTFTPISSESYSEDSGWSQTSGTPFVENVVPYEYISGRMSFQSEGNQDKGDVQLIVKGDSTFNEKDTFSYNSKTYIISEVNPLPMAGVILGQVITAVEQLN